jgi:cation transport regulator ChaB
MILLSHVIDHYQKDLERTHGHEMLPSHHQALRAMRRCRREGSDHMLLECKPCATRFRVPHSCGHRSCPHCQHRDSQQWISRQTAKLLPVTYFMVTFTLPAQLRNTFWQHHKSLYDLLIKASWQTVDSFARRDPKLKGRIGAHSVLHTLNRRLDYHPHVHMIVPAGVVDEKRGYWRQKAENYLFPALNLAKVFRAKILAGIKALGLTV